MQHQEIIVQQPCPTPNGTHALAELLLLSKDHVLDHENIETVTVTALVLATLSLFILTYIVFLTNIRKIFKRSNK